MTTTRAMFLSICILGILAAPVLAIDVALERALVLEATPLPPAGDESAPLGISSEAVYALDPTAALAVAGDELRLRI